jgi:hypothetical protein
MASVVDRQSIGTNTTSPSFTTSVQTGDIVVVISFNDFHTAANISAPTATGYTFTQRGTTLDGGTNHAHAKIYTATAPSTNASLSIACHSNPNDEEFVFFLYVLRGYNEVPDATGGTSQTTASTSWVAPAVTTTAANDLLICAWGGDNDGGSSPSSLTLPGGQTANTFRNVTFFGGNAGDEVVTASGSTGTRTATANASLTYATVSVAFSVAGGGGGGGAGPISVVGSLVTHTNNTSASTESITLVPAAVGNLICLAIETKWVTLGTDDFYVSSMSGGGVSTWNQRLQLKSADNVHAVELWWGVVTATGSSTLTVTYTAHASGGTGASSIDAQEFSYSNAGTIWIMDVTGTSDPNTNVTTMPWPTLAPKMGLGNEAYFGYMAVTGSVTATGLTGFTFTTDARGNPCAVSATVSASVSPQATGSSQKYFSVGMLIAATVAADLPQLTNSPRARLTRASCF